MEETKQAEESVVEDLNLDETKTESVKGGPGYITEYMLRRADLKGESE